MSPTPTTNESRDRVLAVAVHVIGREGARAATVRRVAAAAGVSPALVMHHFGSKDRLVEACDELVLSIIEATMARLVEGGHDVGVQSFLAIDGAAAAMIYVGRSMQEGGTAGRTWFNRMMEMTVDGLAHLEATGMARSSEDPVMRAVLLLAMDLGVVLLRPMVEERLGRVLTDPAVGERWIRAEFDLLSNGVLTTNRSDSP